MVAVSFPVDASVEQPPCDADGVPLEWCWVSPGGVVFADSVTELVAALFPGYGELVAADDEVGLLEFRVGVLAGLAQVVQERELALVAEQLAVDGVSGGLPEEVLSVLLTRKDGPVVVLDGWELPVPLYVLSTQYVPYTEVPVPVGDAVVVVDAVSERGFVDALVALGLGVLHWCVPGVTG